MSGGSFSPRRMTALARCGLAQTTPPMLTDAGPVPMDLSLHGAKPAAMEMECWMCLRRVFFDFLGGCESVSERRPAPAFECDYHQHEHDLERDAAENDVL